MLQRIVQWFKGGSGGHLASHMRMVCDDIAVLPLPPRQTFPHKPETMPGVDGFKFHALLLDGRTAYGEVRMRGPHRELRLLDYSVNPPRILQVETHSMQGWRHA